MAARGRALSGWRQGLPYLAGLAVLAVLHQARLAETLNLALYDRALRSRPAPSGARTPIRLITIDDTDLRQLGWPLADRVLVQAIERLQAAGVGAIGLDLYRDLGVDPGRAALRRLAATPGPLVSVGSLIDGVAPIPTSPAARRAYNDLLLDGDGVVRRDLLHVRGQPADRVALPMRLLEVWRGQAISPLRARLERQAAALPRLDPQAGGYSGLDDAGLQLLLPFQRPGSYPSWSLRALRAGQVPPAALRGSIVLIGSTAPSLRDRFAVPFGSMAGVEIHAHRLAALLALERGERPDLRAAPGWANGLLLLLALAAGVGMGEGLTSLRRGVPALAAAAGLALLVGWLALLLTGLWVNLALPLAGLLSMAAAAWIRRGAEQQRQRRQLQQLLGQTTSAAVARELWQQREALLEGGRFRGRELFVTLLLADLQGFTAVAEQQPPESLLAWLNRGFGLLVPAVQAQGGLVNKFTGDGLLAVFGAPISQGAAADATAALAAARAIRQGLSALNRELAAAGDPPLRLRIGLHSGPVLAGSVGATDRWEYGLIGDAVNCAARLESLEKTRPAGPCRILASATLRALLAPADQAGWRAWGAWAISGRSGRLEVWELLDDPPPSGA
ncbi:MAG: adenylate/guanylate cyclase domain-containing protein [Cyanobacteriota bacterium]|nr:adenylate/guanylate cyclase domain-containing protein [Cyanobacteriota bacterium]